MTKIEYLLMCVAEEASEVAQAALKCNRFGMQTTWGDNPPNDVLLARELMDLQVVLNELDKHITLNLQCWNYLNEKESKFSKYMELSKEKGIIKP